MKQLALSTKQIHQLHLLNNLRPGFSKQGVLGRFFDEWILCEILAKKHIAYHKQLRDLPIRWSYPELTAALNYFSINYADDKVVLAFRSGHNWRRGSKTARQLRNGYIHSLSQEDRNEIESRSLELLELLTYWRILLSH